eukprot:6228613-Prymnesium_polylepis.1
MAETGPSGTIDDGTLVAVCVVTDQASMRRMRKGIQQARVVQSDSVWKKGRRKADTVVMLMKHPVVRFSLVLPKGEPAHGLFSIRTGPKKSTESKLMFRRLLDAGVFTMKDSDQYSTCVVYSRRTIYDLNTFSWGTFAGIAAMHTREVLARRQMEEEDETGSESDDA